MSTFTTIGLNSHIVIGLGEVGTAIRQLLNADGYDSRVADYNDLRNRRYTFMHVCIPYSPHFIKAVRTYASWLSIQHIIIHSTVPVGTTDKLRAVYSPIRGKHPHLLEGLKTFVKFFGGNDAAVCAIPFENLGVETYVCASARSVEAMKLWDTTQYGWNIMLEKMIHAYCIKHGLDFDIVYTQANRTYNEGYEALGNPEFKKYVLKHMPGKIGGHCVVPNLDLLPDSVSKVIKKFNSNLKRKK